MPENCNTCAACEHALGERTPVIIVIPLGDEPYEDVLAVLRLCRACGFRYWRDSAMRQRLRARAAAMYELRMVEPRGAA